MMMAELPVPPGFALTIDAYQQLWSDRSLVDEVNGLLQSIDHDDAREPTSRRHGAFGQR